MTHEHVSAGFRHRNRLLVVFATTTLFMVVEAAVGFLANSLVLLADAGHMLTDSAGIGLALGAIWLAQRPANERKTYGYFRAEMIAAMLNALLLLGVSAYVLHEAWGRFTNPPEVASTPLLVVASLGLGVNIFGALLLRAGAKESMNVRGAFLEVWKDILGSVAAISAGLIIVTTGWQYADPLLAAAVGVLILPRAWDLMKGAIDVLLEAAPTHISMSAVEEKIRAVPGVEAVHDLHVWTVTSGFIALSGHVLVGEGVDRDALLLRLRKDLDLSFDIAHVTIQVESPALESELDQPCLPDGCYEPASNDVPAGAASQGARR